jgi:single-strand DNA-binding protein
LDTSYWDCVAFGQLAENVCASLSKGLAVIVTGKAAQRTWEAKDGTKRRSIEVTADEVAPSLRYATAKVSRADRSAPARDGGRAEPDPWATAEPGGFSDSPPF